MYSKRNFLVILLLVCVTIGMVFADSVEDKEVVARYEAGEITRSELQKVANVVPWQIREEYILGNDYSRFAQIYAVGKSLTNEQIEFVLQNEEIARVIHERREDMLSRALYNHEIADNIIVSDEEVQSYYETRKETEFYTPERYKIKHIFISTYRYPPKEYTVEKGDSLQSISLNFLDADHYWQAIKELNDLKPETILEPGMTLKIPYTWGGERVPIEDEEIIETRREWAEYIRSLALRPDTDFAELAEEYSQTDQEDKGAIIGPIPDPRAPKPVLPELMETLRDIQPGEISPVIRTKHGFEIIKLVEIIPEETRSLEEVENQIRSRLNREKQQVVVNDYLDELKNAPFVSSYFEILEEESPDPGAVLIEVGNYQKTYQDLLHSINENPALAEAAASPERLKQYLESILIRKAIVEQARRMGLEECPDFTEEYSGFKAVLLGDQYLDMRAQYLTEEVSPSEETMIEYYEENKSRFHQPARFQIAQISRKIEESEEDTLAIMKKVHDKLLEGENLENLAREYSTDAYASRGGDVGFIRENARSPEYMEVVFALEPGDISEPFKVQDAWYIIKLMDKTEAHTRPYEEVSEQVRQMYNSSQYNQTRTSLLKEMLEKINFKLLS